jgi:predicted flap endonuclease-1-like 5' DNA nuclease
VPKEAAPPKEPAPKEPAVPKEPAPEEPAVPKEAAPPKEPPPSKEPAPKEPAPPEKLAPLKEPALPPLKALPGMREDYLRQLAEIGITSLKHLAAAAADDLAKAVKGLSPKSAAGFIERAKKTIASARRPTTKPGVMDVH